jgi:hypothetical protein
MPKRTFLGTVGDSGTGALRIPAEGGGYKTLPIGQTVELTESEAAHADGLKDAFVKREKEPDRRLPDKTDQRVVEPEIIKETKEVKASGRSDTEQA